MICLVEESDGRYVGGACGIQRLGWMDMWYSSWVVHFTLECFALKTLGQVKCSVYMFVHY